MAEPLKNSFGPDIAKDIAAAIECVHPDFKAEAFLVDSLDGFEQLELTPRARQISDALARHLPADRKEAMEILMGSLGSREAENLEGMEGFRYLPHVFFIADHGLEHFETAMEAQYELTQRFTAEFSIRAYLEHHTDATLKRLGEWASDPSEHVRRLVSEGTRPRLPWAARLPKFMADPAPVLLLLERLKDDPSEYVRRSVANNLNDIAKDHPDLVVETCKEWWDSADQNRRKLVKHGLRTLIKQGDPNALKVLGYGPNSPAEVDAVTLTPGSPSIGEKVRIEVKVSNPTSDDIGALVDLAILFVKANSGTSRKVFRGAELELAAGASTQVRKTVSLAQHSTRKHYPGTHQVEVLLNGKTLDGGSFELLA